MVDPSLFDYADRYPNKPGHRRAGTSQDAADDMAERAPTLRDLVLAEIRRRPTTVHEAAADMNRSVASIQPRFSELERRGLIFDSGERRINTASGKRAIVWTTEPPNG